MADGADDKQVRYQMDVYFESFPNLDPARMQNFINESDPNEDPCEVIKVSDEEIQAHRKSAGGIRLDGLMISLGEFQMIALIHDVPSPAAEGIEYSNLPDVQKKRLGAHKAFAMLTNMGGENYKPYENLIFLYKVAMAMCEQGAIGCGNVHTDQYFPRELLLGMVGRKYPDMDGGGELTLWDVMRDHHEPRQLLMSLGRIESGGKEYYATRGFSFCGFPDMICPVDEMKPKEVSELFNMMFDYLMENGPVIEPGHTIGPDEKRAYRFHEPPAGFEMPYMTGDVLLVKKEK